jgi:hypothetical protein
MDRTPTDMDPRIGIFRWAWHRAKLHRSRFIIGGILFAVVTVFSVGLIPSDWGSKLEIALMAIGIGIVAVVVVALAFALVSAPYEQRDAFRGQLAVAKGSNEESRIELSSLKGSAIDLPHRDAIQVIARSLHNSISSERACSYRREGAAAPDDPNNRIVIRNHCPWACESFDKWDKELGQVAEITRLTMESVMAIVTASTEFPMPPWVDGVGMVVGKNVVTHMRGEAMNIRLRAQSLPGPGGPELFLADQSTATAVRTLEGIVDEKWGGVNSREADTLALRIGNFALSLSGTPMAMNLNEQVRMMRTAKSDALTQAARILDAPSIPILDGCPLCPHMQGDGYRTSPTNRL